MSGYALPGLFPPLGSAKDAISRTVASMTSQVHFNTKNSNNNTDVNDISKDSYEEEEEKTISSSSYDDPIEVDIVVQEAKIDSAKLVQSLTSTTSTKPSSPSSSSSSSKKTLLLSGSRKNSKYHNNNHNNEQQQNRGRFRRPHVSAGSFNPNVSPQEESTQFQLRISLNGRTYTAIRSLPCILRLRQDLVSELEQQQQQQQQDNSGNDTINDNHNTQQRQQQNSRRNSPRIPEVPRMTMMAGASGAGVVGRGFSFLQALISSYTPALEGWLRQVTSLVPPNDSPSLMQFLWEPLVRRSSSTSTTSVSPHLDSIEESEHDFLDE